MAPTRHLFCVDFGACQVPIAATLAADRGTRRWRESVTLEALSLRSLWCPTGINSCHPMDGAHHCHSWYPGAARIGSQEAAVVPTVPVTNPIRKTSSDRSIDWASLAQSWIRIATLLRLDSRCSGAVGARQTLRGVPRQVGAAGRGGELGGGWVSQPGTGQERVWNGGGGTGTDTYPFPFSKEAMPSHL